MALKIKRRRQRFNDLSTVDLDNLESIVDDLKYCGSYDPNEIRNRTVKFRDERHGKTCYVRFQNGKIFLREARG